MMRKPKDKLTKQYRAPGGVRTFHTLGIAFVNYALIALVQLFYPWVVSAADRVVFADCVGYGERADDFLSSEIVLD